MFVPLSGYHFVYFHNFVSLERLHIQLEIL